MRVLATQLSKVSHDTELSLGEEPTAASDYFMRELRRRALDCGLNGEIAYNGRAVYTANYRSSLPFDEVRRKSRGLGLRCREDYEELGVPKYAPARPADMFPDRWLGWDDYLGVRRPYDEGRRVARTLGIASELRWYTYALDRPAVLEDLRLPFRPPQAYGDEWRGWGDWLGTSV